MATDDQIVTDAQHFITTHGPGRHGPPIQALLNAVSGVSHYQMGGSHNQGIIQRRFTGERILNNHVVDYDTLISHFWEGVFHYLPKALPLGAEVPVREVELGGAVQVEDRHGRAYTTRQTKLSSIKFLRMQGVAAARKFINSCYRTRLKQQCNACGKVGSLGPMKEIDKGCPKCLSMESAIMGGVMRHRTRKCSNCHVSRACDMKRVCGHARENDVGEVEYEGGCGSIDVQVIQGEEYLTDTDRWDAAIGQDNRDPEIQLVTSELEKDAAEFIRACNDALPKDARDPMGDSQSRKILRILVDPKEGQEICRQCAAEAPQVCSIACGVLECGHKLEPDPKVCCGAAAFTLTECVNYSKKLGGYLGYTASLANRRTAKIRKYVLDFARSHERRYVTARYLVRRLADA